MQPVYVLFAHPLCTRDLKNTTAWQQAQREARGRGKDNPIFTGEIGMWDSVVIVESELVPILDNVGASSIDVAANFLCGAQALCIEHVSLKMGPKRKLVTKEKLFDYDSVFGIAMFMGWAHGKAIFNSKDHGVVTMFNAAVAD